MTGPYTKHQRTPRRQRKQCNISWIVLVYPLGVTTLDLSSVQTRHKHCGARLTTEQQANQCRQSHLMELLLNEEITEIPWGLLWLHADLQKTCGNKGTEVQKGRPVLKAVCQGYCTMPPLPSVPKCGAHCHRPLTRPLNNGTDKSAKAGQSAEQGNAGFILGTTKNTPIETMRFMLDLPPTQTRQKVVQVKACFIAVTNPHNPLQEAVKDTKGCTLGRGKSWMGQVEDSTQQVCNLTELKQTKEWER